MIAFVARAEIQRLDGGHHSPLLWESSIRNRQGVGNLTRKLR